jgi:hypothetical protein
MLQRTLPAGFIAPCLPTRTTTLPSGSQWLHEIKHDGFRIIARKSNGWSYQLCSSWHSMLFPLAFWLQLRPLAWRKSFRARQRFRARQNSCALAFASVAAIVLYLFK